MNRQLGKRRHPDMQRHGAMIRLARAVRCTRGSALVEMAVVMPMLLILFASVWLSMYLARRITTPIRIVAEGAERIAAGERGVRVDFAAGDHEFRALIESAIGRRMRPPSRDLRWNESVSSSKVTCFRPRTSRTPNSTRSSWSWLSTV